MAADQTTQPEFRKVSRREGAGPGRYDSLDSTQSMLVLIMTIFSAFGEEPKEDEEDSYDFAAILGFENETEFHGWRQSVRNQKLNAEEAARTLDTNKINFTAAANVDIPGAARQNGHPLLDLIAKNESNGDYNVAFGGKKTAFTSMTIDQVLDWQAQARADGAKSTAVGRYQFLSSTLGELKTKLKLSGDELFDETMQDRLAICLLDRRGYSDFLTGRKSESEFMLAISKEWASLPRDMSGLSYYHGDGLNKAHTKAEEVVSALEQIRANAESLLAQNTAQAVTPPKSDYKQTV